MDHSPSVGRFIPLGAQRAQGSDPPTLSDFPHGGVIPPQSVNCHRG